MSINISCPKKLRKTKKFFQQCFYNLAFVENLILIKKYDIIYIVVSS